MDRHGCHEDSPERRARFIDSDGKQGLEEPHPSQTDHCDTKHVPCGELCPSRHEEGKIKHEREGKEHAKASELLCAELGEPNLHRNVVEPPAECHQCKQQMCPNRMFSLFHANHSTFTFPQGYRWQGYHGAR